MEEKKTNIQEIGEMRDNTLEGEAGDRMKDKQMNDENKEEDMAGGGTERGREEKSRGRTMRRTKDRTKNEICTTPFNMA